MKSAWLRQALPWVLLLAVALGAAWLRYGLIESSTIGALCSGSQAPSWCDWRQALVLGFLHDVYGIAALIVIVPALLLERAWLAWLAAAMGVFALELYCVEPGVLALLVGCLRLLRLQSRAAPVEQHRQRQQQIQSQP